MNKLIGITPRTLTEEGVLKQFVNQNYVEALIKEGFNAIMLTLNNPNLEAILELCDGFLVTGGSDLDPVTFGETNDEGLSKGIKPDLDVIDKFVIDYAVKTKRPMMGICRGIQSINVFMGGTLHQHIGDDHKSVIFDHKAITCENNFINFPKEIIINSYHHQAIKDVAPNFKVVATHEDGTIEAIVHDFLPIFAVQWHPEKLGDDPISKIVFEKFKSLF